MNDDKITAIDETGRRTAGAQNIDVQILVDFLRGKTGLVKYSEMTTVLGRDVRGAAWTVLAAARRALEREGIVFGTVRGVGIKRLNDVEIIGTGRAALTRARRAMRRSINTVGCVDYDSLDDDSKVQHNTYLSIMSAINKVTHEPQIRRVQVAVQKAQAKLPLARTLDAFKG